MKPLTRSLHHGLNLVHKPLLPGEDSRLRAILHLQLAENIGDVPLIVFSLSTSFSARFFHKTTTIPAWLKVLEKPGLRHFRLALRS